MRIQRSRLGLVAVAVGLLATAGCNNYNAPAFPPSQGWGGWAFSEECSDLKRLIFSQADRVHRGFAVTTYEWDLDDDFGSTLRTVEEFREKCGMLQQIADWLDT